MEIRPSAAMILLAPAMPGGDDSPVGPSWGRRPLVMILFRPFHRLGLFVAGSFLLWSSAPVPAAVTWNAPQTISGDTDVSTVGTLVRAFNLGPSGVPQVTLNGVVFESFVFPTSASVSNGNFAFVETPGFLFRGSDAGSASAPFSNLSADYRTLLSNYGASNDPATITLTMSGLSSGQDYLFQWWNNYSASSGIAYDTTATAGIGVALDANLSNAVGGVGQFVTGSFTASGSTQAIDFTSAQWPMMNAFQLRAVPEPSTYAVFAGVIALAVAIRRRCRLRSVSPP